MVTYSKFKDVQEHNPLAIRNIVKKINPIEKLRDKLGRKGLAGNAKKDLKGLKKNRDSIKHKLGVLNVKINDLEDEVRT